MEETKKEFKEIQNFVDRLKSTNSNNDKIDIIKEYQDNKLICEILEYVYSPFKQYYTTSANLKKLSHLCYSSYLGSLQIARVIFSGCCVCMIISIFLFMHEIRLSNQALKYHLSDMDSMKKDY